MTRDKFIRTGDLIISERCPWVGVVTRYAEPNKRKINEFEMFWSDLPHPERGVGRSTDDMESFIFVR